MAAPVATGAAGLADRLTAAAERRPRLALVLLCLALWLPGFFSIPPSDRDEARFAQASRQMVESGDWVRIRFGEEERNKKPAGIHWLQAGTVLVAEALHIGDRTQIWPYRLPGLLGALAAVLATFQLGRGIVGRRAALLAAAMLGSCLVLVVETHIAKTDAALLGTVAIAMGLFTQAYLRPAAFTAKQAAGFWLALGASILLKGPIGPLVPLLAGITLAIADRGAPWLRSLRLGWGLPLMVAAAAPWFIAIGIATEGRFFTQAVGGDMLSKVGAGEEKHWGPPGFYLLTFCITAFPAGFLVLAALPSAWRDRHNPVTRALLAWVVPSWLLFEAVQTKLPHYTLPMFPALMMLGAAWAMDPLRRAPPRWVLWLGRLWLAGVALGLAAAAVALPLFLVREVAWGALLAVPAALALAWFGVRAARRAAWTRAMVISAVLAVPLLGGVLEGVLPRLEPIWLSPRLAAAVHAAAPGLQAERIGLSGFSEPSAIFALGGATRLLRGGDDAARFLAAAPGRLVAVSDRNEAAFRREATALGLAPQEVGSVTGINYSRGRYLTLMLFRQPTP